MLDGALTSPLLLVGPTGTGRKFAVRHLVQDLFCSDSKAADCPCADCFQVRQGCHPDFSEIVAGEKDIGVDAIRAVIYTAYSRPTMARYRVFLIDGADRLTNAAANALLKTLEEPPSSTRFFLLAESLGAVIPTVRSRCGLVTFQALPERYVLSKLHPFEADPTKALVYARMGEGSVGKSIQFWGSGRLSLRDKAFSLLRLSASKDVAGLFALVESVEKELHLLLRFTEHLLHDILMVQIAPEKLINLDLQDALVGLRVGVRDVTWQAIRMQLREARLTHQQVKINLAFHVKSVLTEAFAG